MNNFYFKKIVIIDDKVPSWMTEKTKSKIINAMLMYKSNKTTFDNQN